MNNTIDEKIKSDLLDMWLLWERGNWYLNDDHPNYEKEHDRRFRDAIVEYVTNLVAKAVVEAKIDGLLMAKYGTKDNSFEEKFIDNLIQQLNTDKEN